MALRSGAVALTVLCNACVFNASGIAPADASAPTERTGDRDRGADAADALDQLADRDGQPLDARPGDVVPASWWNTAWKRRRPITFDNSEQASALASFPVLIVLKTDRIDYSATSPQGADLRFVDTDGALLAHEIERWDAKGNSFVWVKVPQIDALSSTDQIWLYHGNAAATDGQQAAAVWSNGYQAVWHLHGDFNDSTAQGQHATNVKSTNTAGMIADGQLFNGVDQYIDTNYTKNPATWTTSAWVRGEAAPVAMVGPKNAISGPLMKEETFQLTWDHHDPYFRGSASLATTSSSWKATPFGTLQAKTWHLLAATYDGAALRAYRDGAYIGQVAASGNPVTRSDSAKIGRHCFRTDVHPFLHGAVDEVRISDLVRSGDWIAAEHLSMTDAFAAFGAEEKLP